MGWCERERGRVLAAGERSEPAGQDSKYSEPAELASDSVAPAGLEWFGLG